MCTEESMMEGATVTYTKTIILCWPEGLKKTHERNPYDLCTDRYADRLTLECKVDSL
jgi:hypothetical protein